MPVLQPLDKLVVDVLVDNTTDSYSTKPSYVSPEFNNVVDAGAKEMSGVTLCCAQLGFSVMLTGYANGKRHKLLFDAGPEGAIFIRNSKNLGVELHDVEEIAISHGHWDHMGALVSALNEVTSGGRKVPCHVNPGMFFERGVKLNDGRVVPFEKVPSVAELQKHGATVVNDFNERTILENYFYLSGEIPRVTSFEKGRVDHLSRKSDDALWEPDPLLLDERWLGAEIANKGLVIFSSCSHAGVVNVLYDARKKFPNVPIHAVFGGLHLVGKLEAIIPQTVENMKEFKPNQIIPAHCSGWRAQNALLNAFGEEVVVPCAVGSRYNFS